MALKQELTPQERIKAAYLHYVLGVEQQAIAVAFEVNGGRVNEACLAIQIAADAPKEVRAMWEEDHSKQTRRKPKQK